MFYRYNGALCLLFDINFKAFFAHKPFKCRGVEFANAVFAAECQNVVCQKCLVFFCSFAVAILNLCFKTFVAGKDFVYAVPRLGRVAITDQTAIVRQSGIVNRARQAQRDKLDSFLADRKNTFAEIDVHNAKILAENAEIGTQMAARTAATKAKKQASKISQDTAIEMLDNMSAASDGSEDFNAIASLESFTENQ